MKLPTEILEQDFRPIAWNASLEDCRVGRFVPEFEPDEPELVTAGEGGGQPCGDSFIAGDKECHVGEGKPFTFADVKDHTKIGKNVTVPGGKQFKFFGTKDGYKVAILQGDDGQFHHYTEQQFSDIFGGPKPVAEGFHPSGLKKLTYVDNSKWSAHSTAKKFTAMIASYEDAAAKGDSAWLAANPPGQLSKPEASHDSWDKKAVSSYKKAVEEAAKHQTKAATEEPDALDISKWKKVGPQLGSNPGGLYEDEAGKKWYVKHSKSDDHARNEVLAARLYEAADAPVLGYKLTRDAAGKLGTATAWVDDKAAFDVKSNIAKHAAQEHFATHAWLANWDAVGLAFDNQAGVKGKLTTLDTGGAMRFRAQGEPKPFGDQVSEWNTLRDPAKNPQAAAVFGSMTVNQQAESAAKVAAVPDAVIDALVKKYGPKDPAENAKLAATIKVRKLVVKAEGEAAKAQADLISKTSFEPVLPDPDTMFDDGNGKTLPGNPGVRQPKPVALAPVIPPAPTTDAPHKWPVSLKKIEEIKAAIATGDVEKVKAVEVLKGAGQLPQSSFKKKVSDWHESVIAAMSKPPSVILPEASKVIPPPPEVTANSWKSQYEPKFAAIHAAAVKGDVVAVQAVKTNPEAALSWAKKLHAYKDTVLAALGAAAAANVPAVVAPVAPKPAATPPAPKPVFDPAKLPTPPTFTASSVKAVNDANNATAKMLFEAAKAGDSKALLGLQFDELDKASGKFTGNKKPFSEHPSGPLKNYYNSLVQNMDEQLNPPPPPVPWDVLKNLGEDITLDFKPHGKKADFGRWVVAGKAPAVVMQDMAKEAWINNDSLVHGPSGHTGVFKAKSSSELKDHDAGWKKLPANERSAVSHYTGGGYDSINSSLMSSAPSKEAVDAAKGLFKAAIELPPGKWVSRTFSTPGWSKGTETFADLKKLEGMVVQDPAIMSTSTRKDFWNKPIKLYIKIGPGVRGLSGDVGSGSNKGENEIMLPPNTTLAIHKVRMIGGTPYVFAYAMPTLANQCCSQYK